jgi:uncharacterized peroxidase-related enzyme
MGETKRPHAWVTTVAPEDADGPLKEAYDWQARRLGEPTEYTQLGSLHPGLVYERLRLYKVIDQLESGLTDTEKDAVVYVTSVLNQTPHCASGARHKLEAQGAPQELVAQLAGNPVDGGTGSTRLDEIVRYAAILTLSPGAITEQDIEALRSVGLSDADIVALNNLAAYYSYTNRVATGLGLRSEVPAAHAVGAAPRLPRQNSAKGNTHMSLVEVIDNTKSAIAADVKNGQAVFRSEHELVGVTEVASRTGSGHSVTVDEPESLGGGNVAANPVEYALIALGSCQAITYRFWAAQLGIDLEGVRVEVEGDLDVRGFFGIDDSVRPGFGEVRLRVTLSGPEQDSRYEELAKAVDAHCPVLDLFSNPVPVERQISIG